MPHIRPFHDGDSINDLTALLHRAYARLGAMGLNYTPPSTRLRRSRPSGFAVAIASSPAPTGR